MNEICVLCSEVISKKQYVDQVLEDANIISQTTKLNAKTELLEKENMELRIFVIIKKIIIMKDISKTDKVDCLTNKGNNTLSPKVLHNVRIHQKKTLSFKMETLTSLTKTKTTRANNQPKSVIINRNVFYRAKT